MPTILLIEDEPEMRRVLARALARKYLVVEAADGEDGLEALKRHRPDLVVTDIIMPHKEGLETIREIRRRAPGTRIIAISGGGIAGDLMFLDAARALGADAVLSKPFPLERFLAAVDKLIRPTLH